MSHSIITHILIITVSFNLLITFNNLQLKSLHIHIITYFDMVGNLQFLGDEESDSDSYQFLGYQGPAYKHFSMFLSLLIYLLN